MSWIEGRIISGEYDNEMNVFTIQSLKQFSIETALQPHQMQHLSDYLKNHQNEEEGQILILYDQIANHTYNHSNFRGLTEEEIRKELRKAKQIIMELTGFSPKLFRPPGGYYNETIINVANQEGYTVVMWSWHQDTYDWQQPGVRNIVKKVLLNTRNGDIVLFHDYGGDRRQTIEALKQILPELKKRGYKFVTVSELLKMHPNYRYLDWISG
ncbi:MAG TPA: polysaccharide deacetylase family protein [Anoxybacillus sp.]|nr:polysaccharide deacetylase family protein [Anoxybacillus sp.]